MKPRRIMTSGEATEILDHAVEEAALAVLTFQLGDQWVTFKSRFLERDPQRRFVVLDLEGKPDDPPPHIDCGQCVGISFRHKSRKVMFASVLEVKGRYFVDDQKSIAAARYRWPDGMLELQRRAYYRTPIPESMLVGVQLAGGGQHGLADASSEEGTLFAGQALDLSCGGSLVRLEPNAQPRWHEEDTLGLELALPDGRPPMRLDARFRGFREEPGGRMSAAVQFIGLELTSDGRHMLQRLARCVQTLHRHQMAEELKNSAHAKFKGL